MSRRPGKCQGPGRGRAGLSLASAGDGNLVRRKCGLEGGWAQTGRQEAFKDSELYPGHYREGDGAAREPAEAPGVEVGTCSVRRHLPYPGSAPAQCNQSTMQN